MSTLIENNDHVKDVRFSEKSMTVQLNDDRTITVPLWWYPRLNQATEKQRTNWEACAGGRGIHWPDIDEDLDVKGFLMGYKAPGAIPPQ